MFVNHNLIYSLRTIDPFNPDHTMVGNYRHRIHGKGKVRIPKGMSSESNPSKKRHRAAAEAARNASLSTEPLIAVDDRPFDKAADFILADNLVSYSVCKF
ncbi:unnamed protein product [Strongylus vulgaris]|uniref:Uncharacterized protein n=1 Tax=Strongylus vulgaris TaxID=40348 RepID=A0A3P7J0E6_STRVU|nr:unnamed protein product [Strongylus vulgaris]